MTAQDCHSDIRRFHDDQVTLRNKQQAEMRSRRDAGRTRLKNGLLVAEKPTPLEFCSQGSYQMRTMVQDPDNDYDIDDGVYFKFEDLSNESGVPLTPLGAREMVCEALTWDGRLKREAVVKKNCVRQEYPEGYHIDVPVYRVRETTDASGSPTKKYELASDNSWSESDARAVTRWFNEMVGELSRGDDDGSQLRRVTKLSKKFARRANWKESTTSGICITKLVVDNFIRCEQRDDLSLRSTWSAILQQLQISTRVDHPVADIPIAEEGDSEVEFFRDCLENAISELNLLDLSGCSKQDALEVWGRVFDTSWFSSTPSPGSGGGSKAMAITSTQTARRDDGGGRFG